MRRGENRKPLVQVWDVRTKYNRPSIPLVEMLVFGYWHNREVAETRVFDENIGDLSISMRSSCNQDLAAQ